MNLEQLQIPKQETQEEKDKKIAEDLQLKLEQVNRLQPSGDIASDFNNLLELTGRDSLYKKVSADENPHVILAGLTGIKTAWQETLRDSNNVDFANEAKRLFYIDIPQAEIEAVNKLITFYLDKFSVEQEKNTHNSIENSTQGGSAGVESRENEDQKYTLDSNQEFLGFQKVEVTKTDDTKPWKPALEVKVIKADGSVAENLDANTPFFTLRDLNGNEMTVTAAAAGHIDQLHIKGEDAGSKFDYTSLDTLFEDVAQKLPQEVASAPGVSDFAVDMGRHMGKEGIASMAELKAEGILSEADLGTTESVRVEVQELNKSGNEAEKNAFVEKFKAENPDCKVQFQLIRGTVLVPTVDTAKRDTTELFMVFGPGADGKKTAYTMAPGRHMPRHPNPNQHKNQEGVINEETFKQSSEAWFDTVMLLGK